MIRRLSILAAVLLAVAPVCARADVPILGPTTGTLGALNATLTVGPLLGQGTCSFKFTAGLNGAVSFEVTTSATGATPVAVTAVSDAGSGAGATAIATNPANGDEYTAPVGSKRYFRLRISNYSSGSTAPTIYCTESPFGGGGGGGGGTTLPFTGGSQNNVPSVNQGVATGGWDGNGTDMLWVDNNGVLNVAPGGRLLTVIGTGAATNTCTSAEIPPAGSIGRLFTIGNASTAASQTATVTVYNEGTSPTCAAADKIGSAKLGPGQIVTYNYPLTAGLAWSVDVAPNDNIIIARN